MSPADNGVVISWEEKVEKSNKGTFDNCQYVSHSLVFDIDGPEGEEKALDEAFAKYRELWTKKYKEAKRK